MYKKVSIKNKTKYALSPLLLMFVKLVLLITFFGAFFKNFLNGIEISMKFCVFLYLFKKSYYYFFQICEVIPAKNGVKNQKTD